MTPPESAPALLVADTCSYLHLVELVARPMPTVSELQAALAVAALFRDEPPAATLVIPEVVTTEYASRIDGKITDTRDRLVKLKREVQHAHHVSTELGLGTIMTDDWNWPEAVGSKAKAVINEIMTAATTYHHIDEDHLRASARAAALKAPAIRGSSPRDALIAETALRAARDRPEASEAYFLSHNVADFCDADRHLHPDLVDDFADANLTYARSWTELAGQLEATGQRT